MGLLHRLTEVVRNGEDLAARALAAPLPAAARSETWGGGEGPRLWAGDNLEGLAAALHGHPEAGIPCLRGRVDLVYLDPPYFRRIQARQRHDGLPDGTVIETRTWHDGGTGGLEGHLARLYARLVLLRDLLSPRGSLWVQADRVLSPWLRVLLDELLGETGFVNEITWRRANAHNDARRFGCVSDALLYFARGPDRIWHPPRGDASGRETDPHWSRDAEGRLFRKVPVDAPRRGKAAARLYPWKGRLPAPGRAWSLPIEAMEALEREGRLVETSGGNPCRLVYADEQDGPALQDLWDDLPGITARSPERQDYPAQKPEALIERILLACSDPGSWVLDPYAGSGTLGAVAARHGRRALLMDSSPAAALVQRRRLGSAGLSLHRAQPALEASPPVRAVREGAGVRLTGSVEALAALEGWALGESEAGDFRARAQAWRERALGRRGEMASFLDLPGAPPRTARLWDLDGRQLDLPLEGDAC